MAIMQARVTCWRCNQYVDKTETVLAGIDNRENRYECFSCFRKGKPLIKTKVLNAPKTRNWGTQQGPKDEYFCEMCSYKFKAKKKKCPYCGDEQHIVSTDISMEEIL